MPINKILQWNQNIDRQMKSMGKIQRKAQWASSAGRKKGVWRLGTAKNDRYKSIEREFNNWQLKRMLWRDQKQLSIQEKIYKLASYLENNKMMEEKKKIW
jgi:hypothetical protein